MRHFILFAGAALLACAVAAQSYNVTDSQINAYAPIVGGTSLQLGDDDLSAVTSPPGFSFSFFGQNFTSFKVGSNGYISMGDQGTTTSPLPAHATAPGYSISPFWTDLMPGIGSNWHITWAYQSGVLRVEWGHVAQRNNTPSFGTFAVLMQAYLDTATGEIYFHYGEPNVGTVTVRAFSTDLQCVAISGPTGAAQEVIIGEIPGFVNPDGSVPTYPLLREVRFTPTAATPPQITSSPVTSVVAGNQYSYIVTATGMPAPQIGASGLPAWLTLTGNTLEGNPTAADAGLHGPITVTATNSAGQDDQVFTIDVELAPSITSAPVTSVTAGTLYTYTIVAEGHPAPVLGASGLPAWLTLTGDTLSGTPTVADAGAHGPITISATNSLGQDDQIFTIDVELAPGITSAPVTSVVVGTLYSYKITADGHPAPTFAATGLPAWLTLTGDSLEGTPQPADLGTHGPITITATNSLGQDDQVFSVDVMPAPAAPQITSTPPAEVTAGATYTYNIVATGVPTPTISVTGLPAWLSFTGTTISGTPASGDIGTTAPITVTATNSEGSDDQVFSIEVKPVRIGGGSSDGGNGCFAGSGASVALWSVLVFAALLIAMARSLKTGPSRHVRRSG